MTNKKMPVIQTTLLEMLLSGEVVTGESFAKKFGTASLVNTLNRLKSRGVPITSNSDKGEHYIAAHDMLAARTEFGSVE